MDRETAIKQINELRDSMLNKIPDRGEQQRTIRELMNKARYEYLCSIYNAGFEIGEELCATEGCNDRNYIFWMMGIERHITECEELVKICTENYSSKKII